MDLWNFGVLVESELQSVPECHVIERSITLCRKQQKQTKKQKNKKKMMCIALLRSLSITHLCTNWYTGLATSITSHTLRTLYSPPSNPSQTIHPIISEILWKKKQIKQINGKILFSFILIEREKFWISGAMACENDSYLKAALLLDS